MKAILLVIAAVVAVACAVGQYYVPRAYYLIDADGHETPPIPLRRLARSYNPHPNPADASANANAEATANANGWGGSGANANAKADARANANANGGGWGAAPPGAVYGAANPLSAGMTRRQFGAVEGRSASASTSVGIDSSGVGYYDQTASVGN